MPIDATGITDEPSIIADTQMYHYDILGYAEVLYPIYDMYGRLSRHEVRRMHRDEIEKYNKENP